MLGFAWGLLCIGFMRLQQQLLIVPVCTACYAIDSIIQLLNLMPVMLL